jgi:hypothetical protein
VKFISTKNVALLVTAGLIASTGTAVAADTKDAAVARAQAQAAFQSSMSTYIAAHRAIIDARRAAHAKALTDFQTALNSVTTDAQLQAAKDARKSAITAANTTATAALAALVKPVKPAKAAKAPRSPKQAA